MVINRQTKSNKKALIWFATTQNMRMRHILWVYVHTFGRICQKTGNLIWYTYHVAGIRWDLMVWKELNEFEIKQVYIQMDFWKAHLSEFLIGQHMPQCIRVVATVKIHQLLVTWRSISFTNTFSYIIATCHSSIKMKWFTAVSNVCGQTNIIYHIIRS